MLGSQRAGINRDDGVVRQLDPGRFVLIVGRGRRLPTVAGNIVDEAAAKQAHRRNQHIAVRQNLSHVIGKGRARQRIGNFRPDIV